MPVDIEKDGFGNVEYVKLPLGWDCPTKYTDDLLSFLQRYNWLWNHNAVDFYVNNYWENIVPPHWKFLKNLNHEDLIHLGSLGKLQDNWPSDLKEFISLSKSIALPRDYLNDSMSQKFLDCKKKLDHRLIYGMTPKKRHEVENLAALIHEIRENTNINNIIDIGAGQGYLDTCLAFQYGLNVIGIDDDNVQTKGARKKLSKISKIYKGNKDGTVPGTLYHLNRRISCEEGFSSLENEYLESIRADDESMMDMISKLDMNPLRDSLPKRWMLCGLHTCGDLAVNMFRQFLSGPASVLINVGCCYNHVSEMADIVTFENGHWSLSQLWNARKENTHKPGFPMSNHLLSKNTSLGFTARMLACQSIIRWSDELDDSIDVFHRHFCRAVLQAFIVHMDPMQFKNNKDIIVGRLGRDAFDQGFLGYAKKAIKQMKVDTANLVSLEEKELDRLLNDFYLAYRNRQMEVAVVWTLRALLAEAIESLILMDRFLFLKDNSKRQEIQFMLIPVFDQKVSPRNMAFCAWKK